MSKKLVAKEARKWIKENWAWLLKEKKLGEAFKRYYKLADKKMEDAWEDLKSIMPQDE